MILLPYRGSAIARIIGSNAQTLQRFATTVKMWVFEENVNGRNLTDIINTDHENVKYLPGHKLPPQHCKTQDFKMLWKKKDLSCSLCLQFLTIKITMHISPFFVHI